MRSAVRLGAAALLGLAAASPPRATRVELTVVDRASGSPVAARIHLRDTAGKFPGAPGYPSWRDHFVCAGTATLDLPPGKYAFEVERGPEHSSLSGELLVPAEGAVRRTLEIERQADLAGEGWWSGELHVHRPPEEIELQLRAEDLHVAPVITWWNHRNLWASRALPEDASRRFEGKRFSNVMAGEDEREGGALLYFDLPRPLEIAGAGREHPSPVKFLAEARRHPGVKVDIEKPFWWDMPVWVATGMVDTIGLANNHMCRDRMYESEAWGRPRDAGRLPPPRGNGFWTQEIYYHLLNCGLRIPPSAGSASGVLPNPVGYNRAYVRIDGEPSYDKWWDGLRAGRSFVTNGPLLRVQANGKWPGHVFTSERELSVRLDISLGGRDRVPAVEVVQDGLVRPAGGTVTFTRSGWFLVRAIADHAATFRFASTAPFYVEIGEPKRRISRASAKFFLDWVEERIGRIKVDDAEKRREVLEPHELARKFWRDLLDKANAD